MKILGHGVDLVSVERIQGVIQRQGEVFVSRVFTEAERAYCSKHKDPGQFYAVRYAAKEAFGKALGTGIGGPTNLGEIGVVHDALNAPSLALTGKAAADFQAIGGKRILLSLSHDGGFAMASVILVG